MLFTKQQKI